MSVFWGTKSEATPMAVGETDLAAESYAADTSTGGVYEKKHVEDGIEVEEIRIRTEEAAERLGKPIGRYVTLTHPPAWTLWGAERERVVRVLGRALRRLSDPLCGKRERTARTLLFVGVGNRSLTADAIGPRAADKVTATLHIRESDPDLFSRMECAGIAVLAPGVTAETGMEAAYAIRAATEQVRPDLVIIADALAARSTARLATTIQLCDTGISPGSGIGRRHPALTRETLGAPVIALGVPTVVSSRTLVRDALETAGYPEAFGVVEGRMGQSDFFVSPKDIDAVAEAEADILSAAVNHCFGIVF
ncbi:MAG: GPR endopeptidase [Clostridia bacterium]|nr:GPR endopeptidase [Clostridia bacterium]